MRASLAMKGTARRESRQYVDCAAEPREGSADYSLTSTGIVSHQQGVSQSQPEKLGQFARIGKISVKSFEQILNFCAERLRGSNEKYKI